MARIFIVDERQIPDPDPNMTIDQVRDTLANFFPELATAQYTETKRGDDTIFDFQRRVGTKG